LNSAQFVIHAQAKKVYYIGYSNSLFRGFNINDARAAASIMENALIKQGSKFYKNEAVNVDKPEDILRLVRDNRLDFISLTSIEYLYIKDRIKIYPYVAPVAKDNVLNKLILVVRKDSKINSVNDLNGKAISIASDYTENFKLPTMWLKLLLWSNKIKDGKKFIGELKVKDNPSLIANDVFFKTSDACIIYESEFETLKELNPQIEKLLTVIISSDPYISDIGCYTENSKNSTDLEEIKNTTFTLHQNPTGKNLLKLLKVKYLLPYEDKYLNTIEESVTAFNNFIKNGYK